jgi:hypothetical protein
VKDTQKEPVRIIFDTDIGSDCDDAGALAVLHKLADKGEAKILGVIYVSPHGTSVLTGHVKLPQTCPKNPVRRTYELYVLDGQSVLQTGRSSWDQIATLHAVRPQLFRANGDGSLEANVEQGATWTREVQNPKHFLASATIPDDELAGLIEELMVEPPVTP